MIQSTTSIPRRADDGTHPFSKEGMIAADVAPGGAPAEIGRPKSGKREARPITINLSVKVLSQQRVLCSIQGTSIAKKIERLLTADVEANLKSALASVTRDG